MDGFSRILEKKLSELLCTRLYILGLSIMFGRTLFEDCVQQDTLHYVWRDPFQKFKEKDVFYIQILTYWVTSSDPTEATFCFVFLNDTLDLSI